MLKQIIIKKIYGRFVTCLVLLVMLAMSCKKDVPEEPIAILPVFSYEVNCNYCDITYTDKNNQSITVKSNMGRWTHLIDAKVTFDLKLSIKTLLPTEQTIQAYILKNNDVVHGNLGYNFATLSYNTQQNIGTSSFGNSISSGSGSGNGNGGTSTPVSSACGAKNKTGGYCKRMVVGGGRCWQHK
jgi:hypothetical protein